MLYDPKWEAPTKANPFTLPSLIAWLEKQPALKTFNFGNCTGECLYGQYMASVGVPWDEARKQKAPRIDRYREFRHAVYCAVCIADTFGAALKRARKAYSSTMCKDQTNG